MTTTATWATATLPAHKLAVGDEIHVGGGGADVTVTGDPVEAGMLGRDQLVQVYVPDEPVDGYNLWRPKPHVWPSGCTCLHRRHPELAGNWTIVATDDDCYSHGTRDEWED